MSFNNINRNPFLQENFCNNENISPNHLLINVNHNRKCDLKNRFGIITPQLTEDFSINSFISNIKDKDSKEITQNALTNENTTNKTSSNKLTLNNNQSFTKRVMHDYQSK